MIKNVLSATLLFLIQLTFFYGFNNMLLNRYPLLTIMKRRVIVC